MRLLVVANVIPMPDQSAGWFRFFRMLRVLAEGNQVCFHPIDLRWQIKNFGEAAVSRYRASISDLGIQVTGGKWGELSSLLRSVRFEIAFFEHYATALPEIIEEFRYFQPRGRVIVDTVDVAFRRLATKALVTGMEEDRRRARVVKEEELSAYMRADVVIAVGESDAEVLQTQRLRCRIERVPLIFPVQPFAPQRARAQRPTLLFVAHFLHDANVDAIVRFCEDVLPLLVRQVPDVRLQVVGRSPPPEVQALAGPNVDVMGFVPDVEAVYTSSDVAIAPMRYGGGLKGKIAEAMSFGLPVVTNSVSLQGFRAQPGREVLVGDDAQSFADAIVALFRDPILYDRVREGGWRYVDANYSEEAVGKKLMEVVTSSLDAPPRRLSAGRRAVRGAKEMLERHVLWRLRS
jgi:glycosyltransferase involved in cell wall biosynthesis